MTERAQHGAVVLPTIGRVPALLELKPDRATAVLLVRPLLALDDLVGTRVGLDMTTGRGLLQIDARVAGVRRSGVLELELAQDREVVQRRAFARVDAALDVAVARFAPGTVRRAAAALNISGSGALVSNVEGLARGEAVELGVQLAPHEAPIRIAGRVVRQAGERLWAVHFERVHDADRERIVRFVFDRQRLELQRIRRA